MICDNLSVNEKGNLSFAGFDTIDLAKKYGTPLYVLDVEYVQDVCSAFLNTLDSDYGFGTIAYASKALSCKAPLRISVSMRGSVRWFFCAKKGRRNWIPLNLPART